MGLFQKKEEKEAAQLPPPRHIAIIMDGNGRWAKKRGLPRTAGHAAGAESFRRIANYCRTLGVRYLTVYAFSTENWKRSQEEIGGIMSLLRRYLEEALRDMEKNQVHFVFFGDLSKLSPELRALCRNAEARSVAYHEVQVNFCLNYGGRDEIVQAARRFAEAVSQGEKRPEELDEALFSQYLYSANLRDPELIIRPLREERESATFCCGNHFIPSLCSRMYSGRITAPTIWTLPLPNSTGAAAGLRCLTL